MKVFKFLVDLWHWIVEQFDKIDPQLKKLATDAVNVVEAIKKFNDSGLAATLTALIPGDVDDKVRELLTKIIPDVLSTSALLRDSTDLTPEETIEAWLKQAALLDHDTISSEYLSTAAKIVKELSADLADGELSITEATGLAYSIFNGFVKKRK